MSLQVRTSIQDAIAVVSVEGEVDVSNAGELRDALEAAAMAADGTAQSVTVDLAGVSYMDSTGIGVLVGAKNRANQAGASLVVANPQRNVARVLSLLGVDRELGLQ
ncbi:MAG: STAS domain-containing protein [Coriobacteriales bacterium]|nr:STAS domain-containing protein [Coriobacteriales bacterium]